jgi:hypothetical protein
MATRSRSAAPASTAPTVDPNMTEPQKFAAGGVGLTITHEDDDSGRRWAGFSFPH